MGAQDFYTTATGTTPAQAFQSARCDAIAEWCADTGMEYEGYTGSVAEKYEFVMATDKVVAEDDAFKLATDLLNADDPRFEDKWGPAGCIQIGPDQWLFFGVASS